MTQQPCRAHTYYEQYVLAIDSITVYIFVPVPPKNCPAGQRSLGYVVPLGQLFLGLSVRFKICCSPSFLQATLNQNSPFDRILVHAVALSLRALSVDHFNDDISYF